MPLASCSVSPKLLIGSMRVWHTSSHTLQVSVFQTQQIVTAKTLDLGLNLSLGDGGEAGLPCPKNYKWWHT